MDKNNQKKSRMNYENVQMFNKVVFLEEWRTLRSGNIYKMNSGFY